MMRRHLGAALALILVVGAADTMQAQGGPPGRPGAPGGVRAAALRRNVEDALRRRIRNDLGLTDEQATRMERVLGDWAEKRQGLDQTERAIRQALGDQLRPGVAANADSTAKLVDRILANRVAYQESFRDEMRELTPILTPAQRGQFLLIRDRFLQQVHELQQQRAGGMRQPPP